MKKILIVCTGNTCRSPMAGALAAKLAGEEFGREVEIRTAGIAALPGAPASPQAVTVMEEMGLELAKHVAQPVTSELVDWAELILTMTTGHKQMMLRQFPQAERKLFTLGEYAGHAALHDIPDPFGGTVEDYRRTAQVLEEALRGVLAVLSREN
jgi:protein-tyrosine-phosphatase